MSILPRNFAEVAGGFVDSVAQAVERRFVELCDSPIEAAFLLTFKLLTGMAGEPTHTLIKGEPIKPGDNRSWFIEPQAKIGEYRVDFVIGCWPKLDGKIMIVECDGHDFHERTKEQAARDRKRDRDLQALGHKVFRFTGMEIHRDVFECAFEVYREMIKLEAA